MRLLTILSWSLFARSRSGAEKTHSFKLKCVKTTHVTHLFVVSCLPCAVSSTAMPFSSSAIPFLYHCTASSFSPVITDGSGGLLWVTHRNTPAEPHINTANTLTCIILVDPQCFRYVLKRLFVVVFNNFAAIFRFACVHFSRHYGTVASDLIAWEKEGYCQVYLVALCLTNVTIIMASHQYTNISNANFRYSMLRAWWQSSCFIFAVDKRWSGASPPPAGWSVNYNTRHLRDREGKSENDSVSPSFCLSFLIV